MILTITKPYLVLAIGQADYERYGCPYCGFMHAYHYIRFEGADYFECVHCEMNFIILSNGTAVSPIGFCLHFRAKPWYPELQEHPQPQMRKPGFFIKNPRMKGGET